MERTAHSLRALSIGLVLTVLLTGLCFGQAGKPKPNWVQRIDKVHEVGCDDWITAAWTTMLIKQGIVPKEDAPAVANAVLGRRLGMTDARAALPAGVRYLCGWGLSR